MDEVYNLGIISVSYILFKAAWNMKKKKTNNKTKKIEGLEQMRFAIQVSWIFGKYFVEVI